MRTIYRHAYKVKFKAPDFRDRWAYSEYHKRVLEAEEWCEENTKRDWSHRPGEFGLFWLENANDAVMLKLLFA